MGIPIRIPIGNWNHIGIPIVSYRKLGRNLIGIPIGILIEFFRML